MGLLDVSPVVCASLGYPDLQGTCRYGFAGTLHVFLAVLVTLVLGRRWLVGVLLYTVYQIYDWYLNDDDLLLNLLEYGAGVFICRIFLR
jgi:hypothetical protein